MKFSADVLFEGGCLFCPDLDEGYQVFKSWDEFLTLTVRHLNVETRPLYVYKATCSDGKNVYVDASNLIVIPWDELENYL